MGNLNLNNESVEPKSMDFDPLPPAVYKAFAIEGEVKDNSKGNGQIAKFTFKIESGDYDGRQIWAQFNISNPSAKAEQIGLGMLSAFSRATGKIGLVEDTEELLLKAVLIKLKIRPARDGYEASNEIVAFYPIEKGPKVSAPVKVDTKAEEDVPDFLR